MIFSDTDSLDHTALLLPLSFPEAAGLPAQQVYADVTWGEIETMASTYVPLLASLDLAPGSSVGVIGSLSQAIAFGVIERSLRQLKLCNVYAESFAYDAYRVAAIIEQFQPQALIAIGQPTLQGLRDLGLDPAQVLGNCRYLFALPDAYAELQALGLSPLRACYCGPLLLLERPDRSGIPAPLFAGWQLRQQGPDIVLECQRDTLDFTAATGIQAQLRPADDGQPLLIEH